MKNGFLKAVLPAVLTAGIITLSGCFPTGEKDPVVSDDYSDKDTFEYEGENISVSFDIPEVPENMPTRIKLKEKFFDYEEMLPLFFGDKPINWEKTWSGGYYTDDDTYLSVEENRIQFNDGETAHNHNYQVDGPVNYQVALFVDEIFYKDTYFTGGDELDSFPLQDALDRALELTSTLGFANLGDPEIYAVSLYTYEKLIEELDAYIFFNEEYPLTVDDEVYIFHFPQVFDDVRLAELREISINDEFGDYGKSTVWSPRVIVGVAKDRIFYFSVDEAFEAEYEIVSSEPVRYDMNYAISELVSFLEKTYFRDPAVIYKLQVVYYPAERREPGYTEYSPAWSFKGYMNSTNSILMNEYTVFISAENGTRRVYTG